MCLLDSVYVKQHVYVVRILCFELAWSYASQLEPSLALSCCCLLLIIKATLNFLCSLIMCMTDTPLKKKKKVTLKAHQSETYKGKKTVINT